MILRRLLGVLLLSLAIFVAFNQDGLAQSKKGAPPAKGAAKGAAKSAPKGVQAQDQNVDVGNQPAAEQGQPVAKELIDPREAMRNLVSDISNYARTINKSFVVMTSGGLELFEKIDPVDPTKRAPATTYMRNIDGVVVRGMWYHPPRDGKPDIKTEDKDRTEMLRLADLGQTRGLHVWTLDYAADQAMAQDAIRLAQAKSFIPFPMFNPDERFDKLPLFPPRPLNENPDSVTGITHIRNFMMLTDTTAWDTQEDFVLAVDGTNYDAIVLDSFFHGREPFVDRAVDELKYKKLGAKRLVFARMNIGQADTYRYYWKANWKEGSPGFISAPVPGNPDQYNVLYWDPGWKNVITGNSSSYIYGLLKQGFDGVILDGVEAYHAVETPQ